MDGKGLSLIGYVGGLVSKGLAKLLLVRDRARQRRYTTQPLVSSIEAEISIPSQKTGGKGA